MTDLTRIDWFVIFFRPYSGVETMIYQKGYSKLENVIYFNDKIVSIVCS